MKITIILTSYNHEKFIAESIESVLRQTYKEFEFIIVDDFSTDDTWKIIQDYKARYPDIITIRNEYNWGNGVIANIVTNYAHGDYIAIHHSDDVWEETKLEKQVKFLQEHTEYVAVFTNAQAIDDAGEDYSVAGFYHDLFSVNNRTRYEWLRYFFENGNCLCHPSVLIKKSVYEADNFFKKGMRQIPDFVKWIDICKKYDIYVLPERLVKFRIHSEGKNTSGMRADTQVRSTVELYWMLQEYKSITDKKEFLLIFPELHEEFENREFVPEYAWAKVCTKQGVQPYVQLFGETLLFEALNDKQKAAILQKQYSYTANDFTKKTGACDIFGILPPNFEQTGTIYVDFGDGWNEKCKSVTKYALGESTEVWCEGDFCVEEGNELVKVRFDPAEGVMIKCNILECIINGEKCLLVPENSYNRTDSDDWFISLDPIYSLNQNIIEKSGSMLNISILAKICRLDTNEVSQVVMNNMYDNRNTIYEYQYQHTKFSNLLKENETVIQRLNNQLAEEKDELVFKTETLVAVQKHLDESLKIQKELREELDYIKKGTVRGFLKKIYDCLCDLKNNKKE